MRRNIFFVLLCVIALVFCACDSKEPEATIPEVKTFEEYTELAVFQDIPAVDMEKYSITVADDYGDGYFVIALKANGLPSVADYTDYINLLEQEGFIRHSDSGDTGIGNGAMLATSLKRGEKVISLTFARYYGMLYIAVAENKPLSPHLSYDASYVAGNIEGAKTTLTMHGLKETGNCYVLQLKNGHYIVNDGGFEENADMLIQSLIDNAPAGETPVVDAWFISHDHPDHMGALFGLENRGDELIVEGFYHNAVSTDVISLVNMTGHRWFDAVKSASGWCKNSAGEQTPIYRMHAGDRYYFNDITVEVLYTCEQVSESDYSGDLNASCTWLMYYIEGQKFLLNGDTEAVNMGHVANIFDQSFFDVDLMNVPHHGYNHYTANPGFYRAKTLIYSSAYFYNNGWWTEERKTANLNLQQYCEEVICWADGDKKLTFPYTVGSVETLPSWYPENVPEWTANQRAWAASIGMDWPAS